MLKIKDSVNLEILRTKHGCTYLPKLKKYAFYVKDKFGICPCACLFIEEETRCIRIFNQRAIDFVNNLIVKGLVEEVEDND